MTPSLDLLLVDASPSARYAVRLLLQQHGMRVRTAESAERARALIGDSAPDAVLTACVLPGMNGLELLELLKADRATAQIPLVICCPDGSWPLAQTALQRGALAVLRRDRLQQDLPKVLTRIDTALAAAPVTASVPQTAPEPPPIQHPAPAPAAEPAALPASEATPRAPRFDALSRIWQRWRRPLHPLTLGVIAAGLGVILLKLILHRA